MITHPLTASFSYSKKNPSQIKKPYLGPLRFGKTVKHEKKHAPAQLLPAKFTTA